MKRNSLCMVTLAAMAMSAPVLAQSAPSDSTLKAAIDQIVAESRAAKQSEADLVARLDQAKVDEKAFSAVVAGVERNAHAVSGLIDKLDALYDQLSDRQKDTVREAWTVSELFSAFVDNEKEGLSKLSDPESREEVRANAQCAVRRAAMLEEILNRLTER